MSHPARSVNPHEKFAQLRHAIERAAHLLPSQGPITSFVHHNTLHGFEERSFDQGLAEGSRTYGCETYLPEDQYRAYLAAGRIRLADLEAALLDDSVADLDALIGLFGTRFHLRLAMLQFPLRSGSEAELRWVIAETDARRRFRPDVPESQRERVIGETLKFILNTNPANDPVSRRSGNPISSPG